MPEITVEILNKIESASSWEELGDIFDGLEEVTFGDRLSELCLKYHIKPSQLQVKAPISKSMFYDILKDNRKPGKETVIKIGMALKINVDEMNELLKLTGHRELYPKKKEDAIIIFGIKNGKEINEIEALLKECGSDMRLTDG